jgi:hypothetical protein
MFSIHGGTPLNSSTTIISTEICEMIIVVLSVVNYSRIRETRNTLPNFGAGTNGETIT